MAAASIVASVVVELDEGVKGRDRVGMGVIVKGTSVVTVVLVSSVYWESVAVGFVD